MKDALKHKCRTCPFFHQPQEGPNGVCVLYPPPPLFMGMHPVPTAVIDMKKPPAIMPLIQGSYPRMNENEGCWQHPDGQREIQEMRMRALN